MCATPAAPAPAETVEATIRKLTALFVSAVNSKDVETMVGLYAPGAVVLPPKPALWERRAPSTARRADARARSAGHPAAQHARAASEKSLKRRPLSERIGSRAGLEPATSRLTAGLQSLPSPVRALLSSESRTMALGRWGAGRCGLPQFSYFEPASWELVTPDKRPSRYRLA